MNARLLSKGYTPVSNEITLQMPGFKKPVECCFTEYKTKTIIVRYQFVMGSKYVAFGFYDAIKIDSEDYLFIWEMSQKFEYTGTDVKGKLVEWAKEYVNRYADTDGIAPCQQKYVDFLKLSKQDQLVILDLMRKERIKEDPKYPLATSAYQNLETYITHCNYTVENIERTKVKNQRIKEFYGI